MITNKDISIDSENGKITLNGNKYDLGTQGEIDTAVKDVYSVMGQNGAKNLIPYPYYRPNHYEINGITYDVSSDGVITMQTGTSTAEADYHMWHRSNANTSFHLDKGTYILSGRDTNAPDGVSLIINGKDKNGNDKNIATQNSQYPDGVEFTIDDTFDLDRFGILVYCGSGVTISSALTFKPMLRLASDTDNTYEPYAMTNKQLTDQLGTKQDTLTFDDVPTDESTNPVTSGGVYSAIGALFNEDVATHTMALNDTYTIPENVFNHKILLFHINRGGSAAGGFAIRPVINTGGAVYGGFVYADANHYAKLGITASGVVTLSAFKWDDSNNIELKFMGLF